MSEQATTPDINGLLKSLQTIEDQRAILGDSAVDPIIDNIRTQIIGNIPTPTDEQIKKHNSWKTLIDTATKMGIAAPEPPEEIATAVEAVSSYKLIIARIGSTGLSTEIEPTAPATQAPRTVAVTESIETPAPAPRRIRIGRTSTPAPASTTTTPHGTAKPTIMANGETIKDSVIIDISDPEIIKIGDTELKVTNKRRELCKQIVADVVEAINNSANQSFIISEFLIDKTGITASKLSEAITKRLAIVSGVDIANAKKYQTVFYGVVKKQMVEAGIIEHVTSTFINDGATGPKTPPHIIGLKQITLEGIAPNDLPQHLHIDNHRQTVTNEQGDTTTIIKSKERFDNFIIGLNVIAGREISDNSSFTRKDLRNWINSEPNTDELSVDEIRDITDDLTDIVRNFGGRFPIRKSKSQRAATFSWLEGSTVTFIDGSAEKSRFNDSIKVLINNSGGIVNIDGIESKIIDYDSSSLSDDEKTANSNKNRKIFEVFACMSKEDKFDIAYIAELIDEDISDEHKLGAFTKRIRVIKDKLNSISEAPIINWVNKHGIKIDLNRSFELTD